jgi:hypothetical protein
MCEESHTLQTDCTDDQYDPVANPNGDDYNPIHPSIDADSDGNQDNGDNVPWGPFKVVQSATRSAIDLVASRNPGILQFDKLAMASFSSGLEGGGSPDAELNAQLTFDYNSVKSQVGTSPDPPGTGTTGLAPNGFTNIGQGIVEADAELSSANARPDSVRVIIILTDGAVNRGLGSSPGQCGSGSWSGNTTDGCSEARNATTGVMAAVNAMTSGAIVYTINMSADPNAIANNETAWRHRCMMIWVADRTDDGGLDGDYSPGVPANHSCPDLPAPTPGPGGLWHQVPGVTENWYFTSNPNTLSNIFADILTKVYTRILQ